MKKVKATKKEIKNPTKKQQAVIAKRKTTEDVINKRIMTPDEVIEHCKADIIDIYVPSMKACVRCQLPVGDTIYKMRISAENDMVFKENLFKACLMDFSEEQIKQLEKSNGLRYMELFTLVMGSTDLFLLGLGKDNIKN